MEIQSWDTEAFDCGIAQGMPLTMVEFYTENCPFCKNLAKTFEQLARDWEGRAVFAKVDLGKESSPAARYRIRSVPTVMVFANGELVGRSSGAVSRRTLAELLEKASSDGTVETE